ncbi:MAG: protein kinase [Kiritimatiellae bacterium]|nr:protein kinase [Kiritimatiellia bacterium]
MAKTEDKRAKVLDPGDKFGDYTVVKLLGKGGMGVVYLMRGTSGVEYAVKIMFPDKVSHEMRRRFAHEAEFAINIRHKNLVSVYDVGEDPETGLCYMIMDYVPGGTLDDKLAEKGRIPVDRAVSIAVQIAEALDVAHGRGIVHRDIKPDNIMFDADGTPKLTDLGVAKFDNANQSMVTTTGMVIGTPAYMAPEQMLNSHNIDGRADIYALGVVLYEMLCGKHPNEGRTAIELMAKALKGDPLPDILTICPKLPPGVAYAVSTLCSPKPDGRPPNALAAAELLRKAVSGQLVPPKQHRNASNTAESARRRLWLRNLLAVAAAAVGVAALCITAVSVVRHGRSRGVNPRTFVVSGSMTNVVERMVEITNLVAREILVTNLVAREVVVTNLVAREILVTNLVAREVVVTNFVTSAADRSDGGKRIFVEVGHDEKRRTGNTPPLTLERVESEIADGVDMIRCRLGCTKDGVLFSVGNGDVRNYSDGTGRVGDYDSENFRLLNVRNANGAFNGHPATLEEMLRRGDGKIRFRIGWERREAEAATRALAELLNRLGAWKAVILELGDESVEKTKALLGEILWGKICSGELEILVPDRKLDEWAEAVPECSAGFNARSLEKHGRRLLFFQKARRREIKEMLEKL